MPRTLKVILAVLALGAASSLVCLGASSCWSEVIPW